MKARRYAVGGTPTYLRKEKPLLGECSKSRSRNLYPFAVVALNTGMRYSEVRLLQSGQVDLVGRSIADHRLQKAWKFAKKRSGVKVRLHDLRHTAATRMLEAGVGLTVIGEIRGVESVAPRPVKPRFLH